VARSDQVLDRALAWALSNISPDIVSFYNLSLEDAITTLSLEFDTVTMYDSPLQSLSLLRDALDGTSVLAHWPSAVISRMAIARNWRSTSLANPILLGTGRRPNPQRRDHMPASKATPVPSH
jgi:hypothetical protein